ncbi:tRNA pseudouridine(38-40) synthase TruA [Flavobacteriaceae bacterium TP-CH-4]|uniref:tRNA pseudouridine synthase A n=1 Tax=Pelagihabitans pacificus TaxID=2696054 RepID=A0A967B112_9FLAO|nr:tRNA pseudouridine(38-40) synthase TruA [Pelagihabitans pacificus]NHF60131.1 tRNA pseudouridine(38-40) synthase TruA [Pelagihabitans pacificus]
MKNRRHYYLLKTQFLGFRYSGWQKQPGQKTVEGMLSKTLRYILPDRKLKILGVGRTDAKVSALSYAFELFIEGDALEAPIELKRRLNQNLPPDIRITDLQVLDKHFNIIQNGTLKEYVYLFSFGEKNHPYCAPFMANILDSLDIEAMKEAAVLYEGTHDFSSYTARMRKNAKSVRHIERCYITENALLTANFFPDHSYALHIKGEGFMRYQVRMIMGALILLGKGELTRSDIKKSLGKNATTPITFIAPGSGLHLNKLEFI